MGGPSPTGTPHALCSLYTREAVRLRALLASPCPWRAVILTGVARLSLRRSHASLTLLFVVVLFTQLSTQGVSRPTPGDWPSRALSVAGRTRPAPRCPRAAQARRGSRRPAASPSAQAPTAPDGTRAACRCDRRGAQGTGSECYACGPGGEGRIDAAERAHQNVARHVRTVLRLVKDRCIEEHHLAVTPRLRLVANGQVALACADQVRSRHGSSGYARPGWADAWPFGSGRSVRPAWAACFSLA